MAGPCDLQADLVPCIDDARQLIDDLGLRPEIVEIITVEWAGLPGGALPTDYQFGLGTSTQISRIAITPKPKVSDPHPRLVAADPGKYREGDRIVTKVSRTYLEEDLVDPADGAGGEQRERYYLIDGDPFRLVREPTKKNFEWQLHLARMRERLPPDVIPP